MTRKLARLLPRRRRSPYPPRRSTAVVLALALLALLPVGAHAADAPVPPAGSPAARSAVAAMQPGWNLGNTCS